MLQFSPLKIFGILSFLIFVSGFLQAHEGDKENTAQERMHPQVSKNVTLADAWEIIGSAIQDIEKLLTEKDLLSIQKQTIKIEDAVNIMIQKSDLLNPEKAKRANAALKQLEVFAKNLNAASKKGDNSKVVSELGKIEDALKLVQAQFPEEHLKPLVVFSCPMHPEVTSKEPSNCPKCGMTLTKQRPEDRAWVTTPQLKLSAVSKNALKPGENADVEISLTKKNNAPLLLEDLQNVHTKKIHLLIVDPSLTDYHHEHPTTGGTPGKYVFSFTPRKPGSYRIWADVTPKEGLHEYVMADLNNETAEKVKIDHTPNLSVIVDGFKFELKLESETLKLGQPISATIHVVGPDGKPFTELEPIMGAFAHLVGFYDDFQTIAHIHPMGKEPENSNERGGPDLQFHFMPEKPGVLKLFAQVQVKGTSKFAPFTVIVTP